MKEKDGRLVVDFFDMGSIDEAIEENLSPEDGSVEELLKKMGVEDVADEGSLKFAEPQNEMEEKIVLLTALKKRYESHGATVVDVGRKVAEVLGVDYVEQETGNAASALSVDGFTHDELGNPILHLNVSPEVIEQIVAGSEARDVGLSLQMGTFQIKYERYKQVDKNPDARYGPQPKVQDRKRMEDGKEIVEQIYFDANNNPISREVYDSLIAEINARETVLLDPSDRRMVIEDGYWGDEERVYENFTHMVDLAERHPDKNFYAAAGNPRDSGAFRPDLRAAKKRIIEERGALPANLTMVGVMSHADGNNYEHGFGADMYVDSDQLKALNFPVASSFATPLVKEVGGVFTDLGVDNQTIKTLSSNPMVGSERDVVDELSLDKAIMLLKMVNSLSK